MKQTNDDYAIESKQCIFVATSSYQWSVLALNIFKISVSIQCIASFEMCRSSVELAGDIFEIKGR